MSIFEFKTKAQTLVQLINRLSYGNVLQVFCFTVAEYMRNESKVLSEIVEAFSVERLVVRSSALNEDCSNGSNAGHYTSILNVPASNKVEIKVAIEDVIRSYDANDANEILVQPMLTNVAVAGVVFTCDLDSHAPYHIINYEESGLTDTVASGGAGETRTYVTYKHSDIDAPQTWISLLQMQLAELETLFECDRLDVEFAIDSLGNLFILQVRPIATKPVNQVSVDLFPLLRKVYKKVQKLSVRHPSVPGSRTIFGVMPDWNPAEIIGLKPKKLALTLYKELVTDSIWASHREFYGYRSLRSHPLLVSFIGVPYIDMRVDFNSFIPAELDDSIAEKLVNYYLDRLEQSPHFHDKIEFEVVHSCYYMNLSEKLNKLLGDSFSESEIEKISSALRAVTNNILNPKDGLYIKDLERIETLEDKYFKVVNSELSHIDKIYWLLEDCKQFGTLPFAGIARAGFVAVQMLKSIVEIGILSNDSYDCFMQSLNTISKRLNHDLIKVREKKLSEEEFLYKYGHLRPGTYDIESLRYDENFENYFKYSGEKVDISAPDQLKFTQNEKNKIAHQLSINQVEISVEELFEFIRSAIEGREYAKFAFSRSLSKAMKLIEELGARVEISREDLAFLDVREIMKLYSELDHRDMKEILETNISINKTYHQFTKAVKLPSLILKPDDVFGFYLEEEAPNYVSLMQVEAETILEDASVTNELFGKIVFIRSADPGYDYLFSKGIAGLITQFGGANSHMAIRCAELGIPAVIGAGEDLFNKWVKFKVIRVDCATRQVVGVV